MFEEHFQLADNPFSMSPDPRFLMATCSHQEAIAGLVYGVTARKGFMVLTGEAGTGKTTVLRVVAEALPKDLVEFSYVLNPALNPDELLEHVLLDLGIDNVPPSKARKMFCLGDLLTTRHAANQVSALIIDEAHQLSPQVLEEIRLLTNFETDTEKMLQIVLVGQPELSGLLNRSDLRQLKQRVALRFKVQTLTPEEIVQYVRHRWARAGGAADPPFSPEALDLLKECSRGVPRLVNSICENALMAAFAAGSHIVAEEQVREAAGDLDLTVSAGVEVTAEDRKALSASASVNHAAVPIMERFAPPMKAGSERKGWLRRLSIVK